MSLAHALVARIPPIRRLQDARNQLLAERAEVVERLVDAQVRLEEANHQLADLRCSRHSPFYHYNTCFDPIAVTRRHAVPDLQPQPGYVTNCLGVLIDPKFLPGALRGREGTVEGLPIPHNWHADIAEWGTALRAVDLARGRFMMLGRERFTMPARGRFTMIELGCGWGCWMSITGAAARRVGLQVHLIGVEADAVHIGFARETMAANGFQPDQVALHQGIAAAVPGIALFPRKADGSWGSEPVLGADAAAQAEARRTGSHDALRVIALRDLAGPHSRIDLLHVDIQGGEAGLLAGSLDVLRDKVAYLLIGTHSRETEGELFAMLLGAGWRLEIERPALLAMEPEGPVVVVDGVQGWRNPWLLPAETA